MRSNPFWGLVLGVAIACGISYGIACLGDASYRATFARCLAAGLTQGQCEVIEGPNRW